MTKLSVNINKIATLRNARGGSVPDVLLAAQRIEIDLDDGVKANYPKFGKALKPITGLS